MSDHIEPRRRTSIRDEVLAEMEDMPNEIGRYAVRGEIGRGGMGVVYDAYDACLERNVAIKVLDTSAIDDALLEDLTSRFEREMRATSEIFHENLVPILDAGIHCEDGRARPYYVMERIEGRSLEELLQDRGTLDRAVGLRIAAAVARGLAAVHARELVHRDLKPANVLLPPGGPPKLADFGLCHVERSSWGNGADAAHVLGSPHYMAPEQVRSESATARSDLFALGGVLIRMFAGDEPFHASSVAGHLARILHDEPDGLDRLDPDVRALASELMAKEPERRPSDAGAVAQRLEAMAASAFGTVVSDEAPPGAPGPATRHRGGLLGWRSGAVLVGILICAVSPLALHNQLVSLDTEVSTQWRQVENQLARQQELIPKLVTVTERYVSYEGAARERIIALIRDLAASGAPDELRSADRFEAVLATYLAPAQLSPGLRADRQFRALAYEITGTKNRIAVERARYNEIVGELNRRLAQFPWSLAAGTLTARSYFDPGPDALVEPTIGDGV